MSSSTIGNLGASFAPGRRYSVAEIEQFAGDNDFASRVADDGNIIVTSGCSTVFEFRTGGCGDGFYLDKSNDEKIEALDRSALLYAIRGREDLDQSFVYQGLDTDRLREIANGEPEAKLYDFTGKSDAEVAEAIAEWQASETSDDIFGIDLLIAVKGYLQSK